MVKMISFMVCMFYYNKKCQKKDYKKYYEQQYTNKLDTLDEMDKLPETYTIPRRNQEKIENVNRLYCFN